MTILVDKTVTVVVLTHNRIREVLQTVQRLLALPEHPAIIVVDNGSTDGTADILACRFPGIRIIALERNLGAAARNVGIRDAKTPYVALCDDDTWWVRGSLLRAAEALESYPRVAVVTGRVLVGRHEREDPACRVMAHSPLTTDSPLPGRSLYDSPSGIPERRRIRATFFSRRRGGSRCRGSCVGRLANGVPAECPDTSLSVGETRCTCTPATLIAQCVMVYLATATIFTCDAADRSFVVLEPSSSP
jgi:glycosyltransferase involved in cell wall biosynthesis